MASSMTATTAIEHRIGMWFVLLGLLSLLGGLLFGTIGAFQFLFPDFLAQLPFFKSRPLHVSLAIAWIFLTAVGSVYHYLPEACGLRLFSPRAARAHFWLFLLSGLAIIGCYLAGRFGGREYWEFPAAMAIPILFAWILFGANYFLTVGRRREPWPVYLWMWGTGVFFFLLTFSESYLWVFPYFRENMVRELTVQWKANGSLVGSWNMLVYGTAIFVMGKISGDDKVAHSKLAFAVYFLSLTNLMFNWSHHTYPIPSSPFIRNLGYAVSMTELLLLWKIMWDWRHTLSAYRKHRHRTGYIFLFVSEIWVFLNLALALAISVPAVNLITHGTHITVAHAMGSTIGINSMILLASVFYMAETRLGAELPAALAATVRSGLWITNASLAVFWLALIAAGLGKGTYAGGSFPEMMELIRPYLLVFAMSGAGVMLGLLLIVIPGARLIYEIASARPPRAAAAMAGGS
jgi:nitric oxide reductase subunit B